MRARTHVLLFFPISLNTCSRDRIFVLRSVYVSRFFVHTSKDDYDVRRDFAASPAVRVRIETRSFTFNRLIIGRKERSLDSFKRKRKRKRKRTRDFSTSRRFFFRKLLRSFSNRRATETERERERERDRESFDVLFNQKLTIIT